jgi:hypothetical protein
MSYTAFETMVTVTVDRLADEDFVSKWCQQVFDLVSLHRRNYPLEQSTAGDMWLALIKLSTSLKRHAIRVNRDISSCDAHEEYHMATLSLLVHSMNDFRVPCVNGVPQVSSVYILMSLTQILVVSKEATKRVMKQEIPHSPYVTRRVY